MQVLPGAADVAGCPQIAARPCWWLFVILCHLRCIGCSGVCGGEKWKRLKGGKKWKPPQCCPLCSHSPCSLPSALSAELSPQLGLWDVLGKREEVKLLFGSVIAYLGFCRGWISPLSR